MNLSCEQSDDPRNPEKHTLSFSKAPFPSCRPLLNSDGTQNHPEPFRPVIIWLFVRCLPPNLIIPASKIEALEARIGIGAYSAIFCSRHPKNWYSLLFRHDPKP